MREVMFRGKRLRDGKWLEGYYVIILNPFSEDGKPERHVLFDGTPFSQDVDPETVGQFIGLLDKNGKQIFEGDIVCITFEEDASAREPAHRWSEPACIVWHQERFGWYAHFGECSGIGESEELSMWEFDDSEDIEVIGNIHDNPKLMEVKKR